VIAREPVATARAAWWAARAARRSRSVHLAEPLPAQLPAVPDLPGTAVRGVNASLRLARAACLTRAAVLQAWLLAQGESRDLVIGVTGPGEGFGAHAWLAGEEPCHGNGFRELTRRPPR
jgi:hypothetical protein